MAHFKEIRVVAGKPSERVSAPLRESRPNSVRLKDIGLNSIQRLDLRRWVLVESSPIDLYWVTRQLDLEEAQSCHRSGVLVAQETRTLPERQGKPEPPSLDSCATPPPRLYCVVIVRSVSKPGRSLTGIHSA